MYLRELGMLASAEKIHLLNDRRNVFPKATEDDGEVSFLHSTVICLTILPRRAVPKISRKFSILYGRSFEK